MLEQGNSQGNTMNTKPAPQQKYIYINKDKAKMMHQLFTDAVIFFLLLMVMQDVYRCISWNLIMSCSWCLRNSIKWLIQSLMEKSKVQSNICYNMRLSRKLCVNTFRRQKGIAEHKNGHLLEVIRALLLELLFQSHIGQIMY